VTDKQTHGQTDRQTSTLTQATALFDETSFSFFLFLRWVCFFFCCTNPAHIPLPVPLTPISSVIWDLTETNNMITHNFEQLVRHVVASLKSCNFNLTAEPKDLMNKLLLVGHWSLTLKKMQFFFSFLSLDSSLPARLWTQDQFALWDVQFSHHNNLCCFLSPLSLFPKTVAIVLGLVH
jgi:hypothetical protein